MIAVRFGLLAMTCLCGSCGPSATDGGFDSPNPAAKLYAIEQAAAQGDQSAIRNIVEQLDSDDPAVRSLAIAALKRLTGEDLGYRDYDPVEERRNAVAQWREKVQSDDDSAQTVEEPCEGTGRPHG